MNENKSTVRKNKVNLRKGRRSVTEKRGMLEKQEGYRGGGGGGDDEDDWEQDERRRTTREVEEMGLR